MSETVLAPAMAASNPLLSPSNLFYFLLIPAVALGYTYWRMSRRHMYELAAKIPGPPGLPLLGNTLELLLKSPVQIFDYVYNLSFDYKEHVAKVWAGHLLAVLIADPRDIEVILSSPDHIDKSSEYKVFKQWLGNGLLISSGHKWKAHRKLIAPAFHLNVLKSFIDLFNANSREVVKRINKEDGKEFDCHDYMSEATVEILIETAMGVDKKKLNQNSFNYAMAVMKMCDILHLRVTKPWLNPNFLFNFTPKKLEQNKLIGIIHNLTRKVIKDKREAFDKGIRGSTAQVPDEIKSQTQDKGFDASQTVVEGLSYGQSAGLQDDIDTEDIGEKKRMAFLDLLIESSQNNVIISDEEIKDQVNTIMFEGHDTTAAGSSFFLSMMGIHQEIQERVYQEMYEIFGDSDRPATFADTLEMKYLERCLMETLRLYPPVPIIARELKTDVKLASGYTVPAGSQVVVGIFRTHRLPEIYPNPTKFDPDNFLPERTANRHYYAFVPFSAGPRSCVGRKYAMLKLKILLSTIVRNFHIYSDLGEKDFQLRGDIILKREEGFRIRLKPRKEIKV